MRELIVLVPESVLRDHKIDIRTHGVTSEGKKGGRYVKRSYADVYISPTQTTRLFQRNESIIEIDCGFDGNEDTWPLRRVGEYTKQIIMLNQVIEGQKMGMARMTSEHAYYFALHNQHLKEYKEWTDTLEGKKKVKGKDEDEEMTVTEEQSTESTQGGA